MWLPQVCPPSRGFAVYTFWAHCPWCGNLERFVMPDQQERTAANGPQETSEWHTRQCRVWKIFKLKPKAAVVPQSLLRFLLCPGIWAKKKTSGFFTNNLLKCFPLHILGPTSWIHLNTLYSSSCQADLVPQWYPEPEHPPAAPGTIRNTRKPPLNHWGTPLRTHN